VSAWSKYQTGTSLVFAVSTGSVTILFAQAFSKPANSTTIAILEPFILPPLLFVVFLLMCSLYVKLEPKSITNAKTKMA
jgi:hypothetical protein